MSASRVVSDSISVEFVLVGGDLVAHHSALSLESASELYSIAGNVSRVFSSAFPEQSKAGQISFSSIGNSDLLTDYILNLTKGETSNSELEMWENALRRGCATALGAGFTHGGYFEQELGGITILHLNTVMYSIFSAATEDDPSDQFSWLRDRLVACARRERVVWIVGHIAPGVEAYAYTELWHSAYVHQYLEIVQDPAVSHVIAAQLFGHTHSDEFRILPEVTGDGGPLLVAGSLSPIYGSIPSFHVVEYSASSGRLLDITMYSTTLSSITSDGISWSHTYQMTDHAVLRSFREQTGYLTNEAYLQFARSMITSATEWSTYTQWFSTSLQSTCRVLGTSGCLTTYMCALTVGSQAELASCVTSGQYNLTEGAPSRREGAEVYYPRARTERIGAMRSATASWSSGHQSHMRPSLSKRILEK